ncbi:hypothetical protein AAFF_G00406200 [Aldrovandia affinis]|uniref:Uncharacterized protein n=1 Tax=Aldrovandia affinis TaxID=143900 RepID=A0AAD7SC27_9TELE|nr:hypothetical protein AAFF_G00406200 [Aldrovandia affinis]
MRECVGGAGLVSVITADTGLRGQTCLVPHLSRSSHCEISVPLNPTSPLAQLNILNEGESQVQNGTWCLGLELPQTWEGGLESCLPQATVV